MIMIYNWMKRKKIEFTAIKTKANGEMLIVCNNDLEIYFLNSVARFIIEHIKDNSTVEDIKSELLHVYDVTEEEVEKDLVEIIRDLQWKKLIVLR